jgi:hypothetical protein
MREAAENGEKFHLWWHPHNFGKDREKNLENLEKILQFYKILERKYGTLSLNMRELGSMHEP